MLFRELAFFVANRAFVLAKPAVERYAGIAAAMPARQHQGVPQYVITDWACEVVLITRRMACEALVNFQGEQLHIGYEAAEFRGVIEGAAGKHAHEVVSDLDRRKLVMLFADLIQGLGVGHDESAKRVDFSRKQQEALDQLRFLRLAAKAGAELVKVHELSFRKNIEVNFANALR